MHSAKQIAATIAARTGFTVDQLRQGSRYTQAPVHIGRQRLAYGLRHSPKAIAAADTGKRRSLHEIGRFMGLTDHTSVRHLVLKEHARRTGEPYRKQRGGA